MAPWAGAAPGRFLTPRPRGGSIRTDPSPTGEGGMAPRRRLVADRPAWLPLCLGVALAALAAPRGATAAGPPPGKPPARPGPGRPDEPRAKALSLARSAEFLDAVTLAWIRRH